MIIVFYFLTRRDFFWNMIFIFLINLGDYSFFMVICHFFVLIGHHSLINVVRPKNLATPAHFISSLRPTSRRKNCPRTNEEGLNCQETSPRTILSSANRNHKKEERHALKDSLPGRPKQKGLTQ